MCLAVPMEITAIEGDSATCSLDGVSLNASISLVPHAKVGDWAIVHAGYAIELLDESEARETIRLLEEMAMAWRDSVEG